MNVNLKYIFQSLLLIICFGMFSLLTEEYSIQYFPTSNELVKNIFINFQGNGKIIFKSIQTTNTIFKAVSQIYDSKTRGPIYSVEGNWRKVSKTDLVFNLSQFTRGKDIYSFTPEIFIGTLFLATMTLMGWILSAHLIRSKFQKHKKKKDKYWFRKMKLMKLNIPKNSIEVGDQLTSDREDDCPGSSKSNSKNTTVYLPPTPEKDEIRRSNDKVIEYILNHFPNATRKVKKTSGLEIVSVILISVVLLIIITIFTNLTQLYIKVTSNETIKYSFVFLTVFIPVENDIEKINVFAQTIDKMAEFANYSENNFHTQLENYFKCQIENKINNSKFNIQVFDIPNVRQPTDFIPCDSKDKCYFAWQQGRSGCNPNNNACVCVRGFRLYKGSCIDEDECSSDVDKVLCGSRYRCTNTIGSYECHCKLYSNTTSNCAVCQQCPVGSYDMNQCLAPADTNCIDAGEPVKKIIKNSENIRSIIGIKTASNVFGEDVLKAHKLKSNLQFHEFNGRVSETFLRSSRLLVNITLLNINLLPNFEDIQHKSDNEFILNSTQGSNLYHLKKPLLQIMKNYCRHPLPDSYFITMTTYSNRHTKAKRIKCDQEKHSSNNNCRLKSMETGSFYLRSVNEQCSKNKAMYLPQEINSFYCVENNRFINDIFQHHLRESISFHPDSVCDFARRKCNTCVNLNKKKCPKSKPSYRHKPVEESCCSTKCLKNTNCEKMYSPECFYSDRLIKGFDEDICMQGDTVKFTINPQFHFKNNKFRCHIRRQVKKKKVTVLVQFHVQDGYSPGKNWISKAIVKEVSLSDPGNFTIGNISIFWSSKLNTQSEMILNGYQNSNQAEQFFSISKIDQNANTEFPKLQKHGDKSYIEVEFENIFQYSTSNWNSLSCNVNISKIRSVNKNVDHNIQNVIPVSIVQSNENKPFVYILKSSVEDPEIEIKIQEKSSLLRLILCDENHLVYPGKIVRDVQNELFSANLSLQKWPNQWNLLVEGFVSHDATFVNIRITDISTGVLLSDFEQIVFNQYNRLYNSFKPGSRNRNESSVPIEFATYFHLDLHHLVSSHTKFIQIALLIEVRDCFFSYRKYIYHYPHNPSQLGTGNRKISAQNHLPFQKKNELHINQISFQREMYHFLLQYLAIITFAFSIIYFFIIIALIIIRLCSKIDQKSLMRKIHSNYRKSFNQACNQHVQSISTERRMVLFLFVAFKVFYNFVFTLSVGLSLILSLESNLTPFEITPSRFLFSIEQEVRKLDNYCSDELRRHNEFVNTMNKACYDKRKKCELSMRNQLKNKYDVIIDPWIMNKGQPIYKSISNILVAHYQQEFYSFYNYSRQIIEKHFNNQISQYYSYIDKFTNVLYLKTGIEICKQGIGKSNQSIMYRPSIAEEIQSFNSQTIVNLYEPITIWNTYISFVKEFAKLENITTSLNQMMKPYPHDFKEVILSKSKRYFQSFLKVTKPKPRNSHFQPLENEISKYYKTRMKAMTKSNRFQLKISLWQMRLIIVFIDIIIIIYRFYHTLTTIKIIWFGSHIYLAVNSEQKNQNDKPEFDSGFQSFQYVELKSFIRNNPTYEIAEFGLSVNKLFPCFYCCKRLYYICIIIAFTLLIGVISIFVLSFFCIGRSHMNMPSSVADLTLQYMNQKANSITTRHATRINTEKLKTAVLSDYKSRERLTWLQQFFQHEESQIQQNIHHQICTFSSSNNFFRSLKNFCRSNSADNSIHCSLQPCYFINVKSINYTENKVLKDMYTTGPLVTSLILIPLLRFIAVAMLVVSAILIMLGIIYHSSKLLARLFLKFSQPINATILNRNFPLLSKSIMKQHFTHSTMPSVPDKLKPIFNTLNRTLQTNPVFLKGLSNPFSSPVISRSTNSTNHSESRV